MKKILIAYFLKVTFVVSSQEVQMGYFPAYNGVVDKKEYAKGYEILKNSYAQINESEIGIVDIDYWNIAVAYSYMGVDRDSIFDLLLKFKAIDNSRFCELNNYFIDQAKGITNLIIYKSLSNAYIELLVGCDSVCIEPLSIEEKMVIKKNLNLKGLNEILIDRLIILSEKDQRYRYKSSVYLENQEKQHNLDVEVAIEISQIMDEYGYPGKDLVGDHYKNLACLLIEHSGGKDIPSSLQFKEKYFPIVLEAYHKGQLDKGYLKMLIDRIHFFKNNKQVFGSHAHIPFYDEKTIEQLKKEYGL